MFSTLAAPPPAPVLPPGGGLLQLLGYRLLHTPGRRRLLPPTATSNHPIDIAASIPWPPAALTRRTVSPSVMQPPPDKKQVLGTSPASGSGSDSEFSDAGLNVSMSTSKRRKKKIRRILDDTEIGEETKEKIAIEKDCLRLLLQ